MDPSADAAFMAMALELGRGHLGLTAPNPSVGAVLVRDGSIVGRGVTQHGGRPHAETVALRQAGAMARGATLYVTLEPCSHFGQTGPCADAILEAGVARVVAAMVDPDPRVSGQGFERLRQAGVVVEIGLGAEAARRDHRGYVSRVTRGRPMLTLKLAETADGYAAGAAGAPRLMITGPQAQERVHRLRAAHDAILVGVGTVLADDPQLTMRNPGLDARRPLRIALDAKLRTPPSARLVATANSHKSLLFAAADAPAERMARLTAQGVEIATAARAGDGLDLVDVLQQLGGRGITRVLCEGGPTLAQSLVALGLADEIVLVTAQRPLGLEGKPALSPAARADLQRDFALLEDHACGADRWRHFERLG